MLGAVIHDAVAVARDLDCDLVGYRRIRMIGAACDLKLTVGCIGYDVVAGLIDSADSFSGKVSRIYIDFGSLSADCDCGEICILGSAGKAGNGVLLAVIHDTVALCGYFNILIVVEVYNVVGFDIRNFKLGKIDRLCCVAFNLNRLYAVVSRNSAILDNIADFAVESLRVCYMLVIPNVVYDVDGF